MNQRVKTILVYGLLFAVLAVFTTAFVVSLDDGLDCPDKDSPSNSTN